MNLDVNVEKNIKTNCRQMMCGRVNWMQFSRGSAQGQSAVSTVMCLLAEFD